MVDRKRGPASDGAGMLDALGEKPKTSDALAREDKRLRAELDRKRRMIAEVVEENIALKKQGLEDQCKTLFGALGYRCSWLDSRSP